MVQYRTVSHSIVQYGTVSYNQVGVTLGHVWVTSVACQGHFRGHVRGTSGGLPRILIEVSCFILWFLKHMALLMTLPGHQVQYRTIWYTVVQYGTVWYSTISYSMVHQVPTQGSHCVVQRASCSSSSSSYTGKQYLHKQANVSCR